MQKLLYPNAAGILAENQRPAALISTSSFTAALSLKRVFCGKYE